MTTLNETIAPDARLPGETLTSYIMRMWAPHASRAIRVAEREAALKLDREASET